MTILKKNALLALFTVALASGAETTFATSTANVTLDWNNLQVVTHNANGGVHPVVFNWTSPTASFNSVFSQTGEDQMEDSSSTTPSSLSAVTAGAESQGIVDNGLIQATSESRPSAAESNTYAGIYNFASFTITGQGYVEFNLDWNTSVSGEANDALDNSSARAYFTVMDTDGTVSSAEVDDLDSFNFGTTNHSGTFTLRFDNDDINEALNGNLLSIAYTGAIGSIAPVPVPAALWLLGSGLIGLAGYSRRKQLVA